MQQRFFLKCCFIYYTLATTPAADIGGTSTLFYLKAAPQLPLRASDGGDGS